MSKKRNAKNSRCNSFISSVPTASILNAGNNLANRMKFNFSFFDGTQAPDPGQLFEDWPEIQRKQLLQKMVDFSKDSIFYWKTQGVLVVYGAFPSQNSDFIQPKYVPIEAEWGRFRLGAKLRLVGFVLPDEESNKVQNNTDYRFCTNTFYVVFLDKNHKFYKVEKK